MSAEYGEIKIEGLENENGESVTEIQSYLDTFNKEIQNTDGTTITQLTGKIEIFITLNFIILIFN